MTDFLLEKFSPCRVIHAISPLVHDMSGESSKISKQRIFPKILNAHSDHRLFFSVDKAGLPPFHPKATPASHCLFHVDMRLLGREAQEMSILASCSLTKSKILVPPFNKWNKDTEDICKEHGIELIKFEDGWKCMEYNKFDPSHDLWYLHSREFSLSAFKKWFDA